MKGDEKMTEDCCNIHKHIKLPVIVIALIFVLLALGEYYLYRSQMKINSMLSEGLMQLKEETKTNRLPIEKSLINKEF